MKWILIISLILVPFTGFSQKDNGEVHYINFDPFLDADSLFSNPVLPIKSQTQEVGFRLINKENKWISGNYITIFPVVDIASSYRSGSLTTSSFYGGAGIGMTAHFFQQLYGRFTLTSNYHYYDGIPDPFSSLFKTDFQSWQQNKFSSIGLQPQGRLSYSPYDFLNLQVGIDQSFIGQGNRSMLLSDYGAPYPFVQLQTKIWKIEVTNLYQFFKENKGIETIPKYASTHFFNFNILDGFQFGIFESVVFSPKDTLTHRGYEVAYLNPFLFYRPTEYGLGSQDRLLIGLNLSYEFNNVMLYGQFVLDEFVLKEMLNRTRWWANKYAGQFGIKGKNTFINGNRITWLGELNFARPFTYSHLNKSTSYSNQGRPLAHPMGANFAEVFIETTLQVHSKWKLGTQFFFVQQGGYDGTAQISFGKDVNQSYVYRPYEYGYHIGGNGKVNRFHFSVNGNYIISKKLALEVFVRPGIELNNFTGKYQGHFMVLGGIRTNLWNDRSFSF
ncbi:MAG: hypothetical protein WC994_05185 [Brumimicrobium sp.]